MRESWQVAIVSEPRKESALARLKPGVWLVLLVGGCASWSGPVPEGGVPVVESEGVSVSPTPPEDSPAATPTETVEPARPNIAVVLSKDTAAYAAVAAALDESLQRPSVRYEIHDQNAPAVLRSVRSGGHSAALAIGQQALELLSQTDLPLAYAQVLEPGARSRSPRRGVAPLPAYGPQLDAWREIQPGLSSIGIITGPGHDAAAATLTAEAKARAIEVRHAVARSDREMLFVFQRMVPDIEGFVIYPDARILSPRSLRELLAYANKHDVWVLTYNRPIFELGATLLVSADPREIAEQLVAALDAPPDADLAPLPLQRVLTEVRPTLSPLAGAAP